MITTMLATSRSTQHFNSQIRTEKEYPTTIENSPFVKEGRFLTDHELNKLDFHLKISDFENINVGSTQSHIIGKGSFGEVALMKHRSLLTLYAVKLINKANVIGTTAYSNIKEEAYIHKRLLHENIVRMYSNLEDEKYIYLIMEYAPKGNLFNYLKHKRFLSEIDAFYFFVQVCSGLYFLHTNEYIHRDIKPENLLIENDSILKICDFGWCTKINGTRFIF